jgi:hypothetical protein
MDARTITLACSDFKRIRAALQKQGAKTPTLDSLIGEHKDGDRLEMAQSYEWWCAVVNNIEKTERGLAYRLTIQASSAEPNPPKQTLSKEGRKLLKALKSDSAD